MDDFDPVTYEQVNGAWGGIRLPAITAAESMVIARKLVAKFGGRKMGMWYLDQFNRTWAAPKGSNTTHGRALANGGLHHDVGLPTMVHDVGHMVHRRLHRLAKSHCAPHAALEKAMIEHVIAKGWHLPKPVKPKPTKEQLRAIELERTKASIKRWTTKAKRAATAIRKLNAKQRRLVRAMEVTP